MSSRVDQLPREKGSYLLILMLAIPKEIRVGRLGHIGFKPGWYIYTGSAFGPGGLAARLRHHFNPIVKPHWHIDYLRMEAKVVAAWKTVTPSSCEHDWAEALSIEPGAGTLVQGFGCSDCRCKSHLLHFGHRPADDMLRAKLGSDIVETTCP